MSAYNVASNVGQAFDVGSVVGAEAEETGGDRACSGGQRTAETEAGGSEGRRRWWRRQEWGWRWRRRRRRQWSIQG